MDKAEYNLIVKSNQDAVYGNSLIKIESEVTAHFDEFFKAIKANKLRSQSDIFQEHRARCFNNRKTYIRDYWIYDSYVESLDSFKEICLEVYADSDYDYDTAIDKIKKAIVPHLVLERLDAWKEKNLSSIQLKKTASFQSSTSEEGVFTSNTSHIKSDHSYIVGVKKNKLSVREIALLHYFKRLSKPEQYPEIDNQNKDEFGNKYNVNGHNLYQSYLKMSNDENRLGTFESKRKDNAILIMYKNILPDLNSFPDSFLKAKEEYQKLKTNYEKRYRNM